MRKKTARRLAFFMIFCLALPIFGNFVAITAHAAGTPSLQASSQKVYMGTTCQFEIQNVDMATVQSVTWKSNRTSIAKVDQTGMVTPVKVGTTAIKCTIKYKDGTSKVLSCNAVVRNRVAATSVKITNGTADYLNATTIYVGNALSIKKTVTPSNTTDTVYYQSYDPAIATVSNKGLITAKAEGITVIEVRYGYSEEDAMRADNKAVARMYVHVTKKPQPTPTPTPTATPTPTPTPIVLPEVTSVKMTGSQELEVEFSAPVSKSSLINGTKLATGTIVLGKEEGASDFGTITPVLSTDRRKLTLSVSGTFSGTYSIVVSDKLRADNGEAFAQYSNVLTLKDTAGPVYIGTVVGYTGWSSSINFNEPLDISGLTIGGVRGVTSSTLVNYLQDPSNYTLSPDKKSIIVDNLNFYTSEQNMIATVTLSGIRDTAGNYTTRRLLDVYVRTDASPKPLATIQSTERISRTEIMVKFTGAIDMAGMAKFGNEYSSGIVDPDDMTVVYYTIPVAYQSGTGTMFVEFSGWHSFNAVTTQVAITNRPVDFTLDTSAPQLQKYELVNATVNNTMASKLILTYNKEIATASISPYITVRARNANGNISSFNPLCISADVEGNVVTYAFLDAVLMEDGEFTFALPAGMVIDKYDNSSLTAQFTVSRNGNNSDELPGPYEIVQDSVDLSTIYLTFANKLDPATAEMVQNYSLIGAGAAVQPIAATISMQDDSMAKVALTFPTGTFSNFVSSYELIINGVKGYNGTYKAITNYQGIFTAIENTPPAISGTIKWNYPTITMTMSEEVSGTIKVTATDPGNGRSIAGSGTAIGNVIYITLESEPKTGALWFVITENEIYDSHGNKAELRLNQRYVATMN